MKTEDEEMKDLVREMKVFFGPSRQFKQIFIRAILQSGNYTS